MQDYLYYILDFGDVALSLFLPNGSFINEGEHLPVCIQISGVRLEFEVFPLVGFGGSSNTGNNEMKYALVMFSKKTFKITL